MTRAEIEELNDIRPYRFETDGEQKWYEIGCIDGLDAADAEPDISELWHSNKELPNRDVGECECGKEVLIEIEDGLMVEIGLALLEDGVYQIMCPYNIYTMEDIRRWAYIEDLLPKKK